METLIRYGEPSKLDEAPQGTRCKVNIEMGKFELFLQVNHDPTDPLWESLGIFPSTIDDEYLDTIIMQRLPYTI